MKKDLYSRFVDNHGHTLHAVRALATVHPDGLSIIDLDGKDRKLALGFTSGDRLEARGKVLLAGVGFVHRNARVVKVGLCDGVVATKELELNHGAGLSSDLLREVLEGNLAVDRVLADRDNLDFGG